jgi:quercetin dioxygenase-like cupin family protein
MRRVGALLSLVVVLLGSLAFAAQPLAVAQEATPAAEEFMPEGISFEALAFATALALPSTGELAISRVSFDPGTGFPIEEGDPSYALAVIESGELTVRQEGPFTVTRAGALDAAMGEAEESGAFAPETEEIAAGQEVMLQAGDAVLFPPNVAGEVRNNGQERTVVLVVFVGPPVPEGTPVAGTPTP